MLAPDTRTLLTDALRPPAGMSLSRAVALTFTADFESLLSAPLAFAAQHWRDATDSIAVMEAVRRCAGRIDVFCQAGQLAVPRNDSGLLAFLEQIVHPVRRPRPGHLFHPKIWAMRYRDDVGGETALRLLVLSRNLTTDRSWDICVQLDGAVGPRREAGNRPIVDVIERAVSLAVQPLPDDRLTGIAELTNDLHRAQWDWPDQATSMEFHALGRSPTDRHREMMEVIDVVVNQLDGDDVDAQKQSRIGRFKRERD